MSYNRFNNRRSKRNIESLVDVKEAMKQGRLEEYKAKLNSENYKWGTDSPTHIELEGLKPTLGFEIETIKGSLEPEVYNELNLEAVHDGSLRGPNGEDPTGGEYVTGVLHGDMGLKHLYKICNVLNKSCDIDKRCGVHIHIGSLNWSDEDIVYAYALALQVEKEGFSLLPVSRRKNEYCKPLLVLPGFLEKLSRAQKLDKIQYDICIEELYAELFNYVSGGVPQSNSCNKNTNHPRGSKCGFRKDSQRYCWINFVTLIFDTKGNPNAKTLEIRSHGATMNYNKIKNWTKIWVAFANFVSNNKTSIISGVVNYKGSNFPVNLETMVALAYPKSGSNLIKFMRERKESFKSKGEEIDYTKSVGKDDVLLKDLLRK